MAGELGASPWKDMALGSVAGFVDSVGFIALGFFPAHITGNFVLVGATLAHSSGGFPVRFVAFASFIAAVAASETILHWCRKRGVASLRIMLLLEVTLITAFGSLGHLAGATHSVELVLTCCAASLGAAAMGVQSASVQRVLAGPTTTAMTGNVTKLVLDLTGLLLRGGGDAQRRDITRLAVLVTGFGLGAMAGAFGVVLAGFASLVVPIAVVALLGATSGARLDAVPETSSH